MPPTRVVYRTVEPKTGRLRSGTLRGVARGGGRDGHASSCNFKSSSSGWPWRTVSLGRSADPWRVAEARDHRLRTHGVQVSAGPTDETVADLAYIPREPRRQPGVRLDGDLVVRDER
jgi:hypothetical protein